MKGRVIALAIGLMVGPGLLGPVPSPGEDVKIERQPSPEPRPEIIVPGPDPMPDRPVDYGIYPDPRGPFVRHDPAFFEDLSMRTETGRIGVSGWTAPNTPVGPTDSGYRDDSGWFSLGITFTWDGPPVTTPHRPPPARR